MTHPKLRMWLGVAGIVVPAFLISIAMGRSGVDAISNLASVPAIGGLLFAFMQIARDRIAHDRSVFLQETSHRFLIGATSHMAEVAFDKHVAFCEKYVAEAQDVLRTLFMEGPCEKAMIHANKLSDIRREWALWLGAELTTVLGKFEIALRKIGLDARLVERYPNLSKRQECIDEMFSLCEQVFGEKEWAGKQLTQDIAVTTIIGNLRQILGIEELTQLRGELIKRALRES
jgi:hypothetical protein